MTISKVGARDLAARMQSNAARARLAAVRASQPAGREVCHAAYLQHPDESR